MRAAAVALAALLTAACPEITPPTGIGTEYPCGVGGTVCEGSTVRHPYCCPPGHVCQGAGPDRVCEFVGEPTVARRDAGDQP